MIITRLKSALTAFLPRRRPSVALLLTQLDDSDPRRRWEAATVLGQHADNAGVADALLERLADANDWVRYAAAESLSRCGSDRCYAALQALASSRKWQVRSSACDALGKLEDRRAVDTLNRALSSRRVEVRQSAADALIRMADPASVSSLRAALQDNDVQVRRLATLALGAIGTAEAVEALSRTIADASALVRAAAATSLTRVGGASAGAHARQLIQDPDAAVRYQAIQVARTVCNIDMIELLHAALDDPAVVFEKPLAGAAREALTHIERRLKEERRRSWLTGRRQLQASVSKEGGP